MEDQETARRKLNQPVPTINVTPLIDVLLVLLIIFMMIQPRREAKFETQIPQKPEAQTGDHPALADLLMVDVKGGSGPEQAIELNSKSMSLVELGVTLKAILEQRGDKTVFVKAPRGKAYREIVYIIDLLKGVGAGPIGLQIDFLS
jgi:biopolymer transport protein ExbD